MSVSTVGSTIKKVRWMTNEEMAREGWEESQRGVVLEMAGGGKIYASRDEEGNGPGVLFGENTAGETVYIIPEEPHEPHKPHSGASGEKS
jgi:predicted transcriptional regulator